MAKEKNRIVGISTGGHDVSYAILKDGRPEKHAELERYTRIKECAGDAVEFLLENEDLSDVSHVCNLINPYKGGIQKRFPESWAKLRDTLNKTGGEYVEVGHHRSHAANAFFSSPYHESLIITIDGGGYCDGTGEVKVTCVTVWVGQGNKIQHISTFPDAFNPGKFWSDCTKNIFGLSIGPPIGNQCGTVMGMAACGDPVKYVREFLEDPLFMHHQGFDEFTRPSDFVKKGGARNELPGFDFEKWAERAKESETEQFNIAAGLQRATEIAMRQLITQIIEHTHNVTNHKFDKLCLAGGVALNSVMTGKLYEWFPHFSQIYIPPVPYDSGLAIGSPQYLYHHVMDNPRVDFGDCFTPYMGGEYNKREIMEVVNNCLLYTSPSPRD